MDKNHSKVLKIFTELKKELHHSSHNIIIPGMTDENLKATEIQSLIEEINFFIEKVDLIELISKLTKQTHNQTFCRDLIKILILPKELFTYPSKPIAKRMNKDLNKLAKPIKSFFQILEKERKSKKIISKATKTHLGAPGYHLKELNILDNFIGAVYHNHYNSTEDSISETIDKLFTAHVSDTLAVKIEELYVHTPLALSTLSGDTNRSDLYKSLLRHTMRSIIELTNNSHVNLEKEDLIYLIQTKVYIEIHDHHEKYFISEDFVNSIFQNFKSSIQKQQK